MTTATPADRARSAVGMTAADATPGTEIVLSPVDRRISEVRAMEQQYQAAMPRGMEAQQLVRDAVTAIRTVPDLVKCTRDSLLGALMTAAQLGLRPNVPALGHGWVLPYRNNQSGETQAQWILGYQGMIELVNRTGLVQSIQAKTIYSGEKHEILYGLNERLDHWPLFTEDRGEPILHYAIARMANGGVVWDVMGLLDIDRIRASSPSSKNPRSPWTTNPNAMARKSVVRQLFKFLPKNTTLALALDTDETIRTDIAADVKVTRPDPVDDDSQVTEPTPDEQPVAAVELTDAEIEARRDAETEAQVAAAGPPDET